MCCSCCLGGGRRSPIAPRSTWPPPRAAGSPAALREGSRGSAGRTRTASRGSEHGASPSTGTPGDPQQQPLVGLVHREGPRRGQGSPGSTHVSWPCIIPSPSAPSHIFRFHWAFVSRAEPAATSPCSAYISPQLHVSALSTHSVCFCTTPPPPLLPKTTSQPGRRPAKPCGLPSTQPCSRSVLTRTDEARQASVDQLVVVR